MSLGLGIDTGGTYTDSVILDFENGKVLSKAKALTTREDLTKGISNSIMGLDSALFKDIALVSVSSTLATNSVVEGKGCRTALMTIGKDFDASIPVDATVMIQGGHTLAGKERRPLDADGARAFIQKVRSKVDAIAISGYLSVRNPEHEMQVKEILMQECDLPVVCGHELSSSLGFNERTVTAVLNAKLIPIITDLLRSVKEVLARNEIAAPLMVVKGDGSMMSEHMARGKPVETILSGPAASLTGALFLTGESDAVVVDMGGTTTDIGVLRNGRPRLDPEGAIIGGRRTRVRAADILTAGIGGDSRIVVNDGRMHLTPLRVIPLCIGTSLYPEMVGRLKAMRPSDVRPQPASLDLPSIMQDIEFFIPGKMNNGHHLSDSERTFVELIQDGPRTLKEASQETGVHPFSFNVKRLEELGVVQRIGLTPTDILHAEGSYLRYDPEPSMVAVAIQSRAMGLSETEFCAMVKQAVIDKISTEIVRKLVYEETGIVELCPVAEDFVDKMVRMSPGLDYRCRMYLSKKIIGIGAPVAAYHPYVRGKFETDLVLPEHMEVGNAVGAVTGSVIEKVEILIRPQKGMGAAPDPPSVLHSYDEMREFPSMSEAIDYAMLKGREEVVGRALKGGADRVEVQVDKRDLRSELGQGWGGDVILETTLIITAIGKPRQFYEGGVRC